MILGEVTIRVNGKELKTKEGATLNPGGYTNTPHVGKGKVHGYSRKYNAPSIECTLVADEDVDILEVNQISNATAVWEGDNGKDYMMDKATTAEPATLSDSGEIKLKLLGSTVKKV